MKYLPTVFLGTLLAVGSIVGIASARDTAGSPAKGSDMSSMMGNDAMAQCSSMMQSMMNDPVLQHRMKEMMQQRKAGEPVGLVGPSGTSTAVPRLGGG